jgi:membrane-associated phospholipid phosphatase
MRSRRLFIYTGLLLVLLSPGHSGTEAPSSLHEEKADSAAQREGIDLFTGLGRNLKQGFTGSNLFLHGAGVFATWMLISTNADYETHSFFYRKESIGDWFTPAVIGGGLGPVLLPAGLWFSGKFKDSPELKGAGWATAQSFMISISYVSLLKAVTGRPYPDKEHDDDMQELSRKFRFGFWRGGIFWGWPSGHTMTNTAVITALIHYYPESFWLKLVGYTYIGYMLVGVCAHERGSMHWLSDAVAGTVMGWTIGSTVGRSYREAYNSHTVGSASGKFRIVPVFTWEYSGLGAVWSF